MNTIAQELDQQLQKLGPEAVRHIERLIREALALASRKNEILPKKRPLAFPLIRGTPGVVINPTKEQLNDF